MARAFRAMTNMPGCLPGIIFGIGLLAAGYSFIAFQQQERRAFATRFDDIAQIRHTALAEAFRNAQVTLGTLNSFYHASHDVSRQEFGIMARQLLERQPYIQAVEWIPRVRHADRAAFEQAARADGLTDFQFTARTSRGNMQPAPERDVYFPIYYMEPLTGNEAAVGFDMASDPRRLEALHTAETCACPVATAPIPLVQDTAAQKAFLLLMPVFADHADAAFATGEEKSLAGFVLGVYRYPDLFEAILANVVEKRIFLWVFDRADGADDAESVHIVHPFGHDIPRELQSEHVEIDDILAFYDRVYLREKELTFAGRTFTIVLVADTDLIAEYMTVQPALMAGMILFLGSFMAVLLWRQIRERQTIEREVLARTELLQQAKNELQASQERVQLAAKAGRVGIWRMDLSTGALEWDEMMYTMYGLDPTTAEEGYARWRNRLHPDDLEAAEAAFQAASRPGGAPFDTEFRILRANDQATRYIRALATVLRDEHGQTTQVIGTNWDITDQKTAAQASIAVQRQRLANVIEGANVGTWEWNIQTGDVVFNARWADMVGYTLDELAPISIETWSALSHPDDLQVSNALLDRHFAGDLEYYECEIRMRHKNGQWVWMLDRGKVTTRTDDGAPLLMSGTHQDITARKRAETRQQFQSRLAIELGKTTTLKETLATLLTTIFELNVFDAGGVYLVDERSGAIDLIEHRGLPDWFVKAARHVEADDLRAHIIMQGQPVYQRVADYPESLRHNLVKEGLRSLAIIPIRHGERIIGTINLASHTHEVIDEEYTNLIETIAESEIGMAVSRVIAEEAVQKSEERHRTLFETMAQGVVYQAADGSITAANPAAERILGLPLDQMQGRTSFDPRWNAIHEDGSEFPGEAHPAMAALQTGQPVRNVMMGILNPRNEQTRWININAVPQFKDGETRPYQVYTTFEDVTDLKEAQWQLESLNDDLRRSNQELEQFAYIASHDLQEPLRKVKSFTQLFAAKYTGALDEKADRYIHFIVDGAERMQHLIQDILAMSRVTTKGKAFVDTDLEQVVRRVLENLHVLIQETDAVITHDTLPVAAVDESQMAQVFQNVIQNAIKFKGADAPRIHISAEDHDDVWQIAVRDNGIGIDPQYAERIFGLFQRLHTREEYAGTGLGLAICKKIIERHGGTIRVMSEPGTGSTFYWTLPK